MKSAKKTSSKDGRRIDDTERATGSVEQHPAAPVCRGIVAALPGTGEVIVKVGRGRSARNVPCDVLHTGGSAIELNVGDAVLVMLPHADDEFGCVIGRTGPYRRPDRETVRIEADRELVLRCGDASITLRHDGKVLTRADDVATVARRRNRIKGGSVDIN